MTAISPDLVWNALDCMFSGNRDDAISGLMAYDATVRFKRQQLGSAWPWETSHCDNHIKLFYQSFLNSVVETIHRYLLASLESLEVCGSYRQVFIFFMLFLTVFSRLEINHPFIHLLWVSLILWAPLQCHSLQSLGHASSNLCLTLTWSLQFTHPNKMPYPTSDSAWCFLLI